MNNEQVKFVLGARRPGDRDGGDPVFAEALAQVAREPQLRAWHEREQAFDVALADRLRTAPTPAGLREAILAGARAGRRPVAWWRRPQVLALAACVALLLTLSPTLWRMFGPVRGDTLPEFAAAFAGRGYIGLQAHGNDLEKLQGWLAERRAPLPAKIPTELAQFRKLGCRTVVFRGKNISVICFENGREYHLFVASRADFPALPDSPEPKFETHRGWSAASWTDAQDQYVLVSDAGVEAVKRLL